MAVISLEGMRFFGFHGLYPSEKVSGNQFEVDIWIDIGKDKLPQSESIDATVDYAKVYETVRTIMGDRVDLLETLVSKIGNSVIRQHPEAVVVTVKVSKLNPPLGGQCVRSAVLHSFQRSNVG